MLHLPFGAARYAGARRAIKRLIAGDIVPRAFCQYKGRKIIHSAPIHIHYCLTSAEHDRLIETAGKMQTETLLPSANFPSAITTFLCRLINYRWCLRSAQPTGEGLGGDGGRNLERRSLSLRVPAVWRRLDKEKEMMDTNRFNIIANVTSNIMHNIPFFYFSYLSDTGVSTT